MSPKVNIAVIGCGRIAQTHLQAISSIPDLNLIAVADVNTDVANNVAKQYKCKSYDNYKEMIENEKLDIVCVSTPPAFHKENAIYGLSHGVNVLCEKPFATDLHSAMEMIKAAEENNRLIAMASKFRFVDDVIKARSIIESGILGELVLFEITFCNRIDVQNNWSSSKEISGGGVLIDNGSHAVDIARFLVGPISRVQAQHGKRIQKIDVEDTSMLFFETYSGIWGRVDLSWSIHKDIEYYINIFGNEGMLSVGWKHSRYRQNEKNNWVMFGNGYNKLHAFIKQHKHFMECVQGKGKPIIDGTDSLASVKVIEMAYESTRTNKWLDVE